MDHFTSCEFLLFSCQVVSNSSNPMDCSLPVFSVHRIFQARLLEWVAISSPANLPNLEIEPRSPQSPALAGRLFTTEPPEKPHVNFTTVLKKNLDPKNISAASAAAKSLQSCPTLCDPMDGTFLGDPKENVLSLKSALKNNDSVS